MEMQQKFITDSVVDALGEFKSLLVKALGALPSLSEARNWYMNSFAVLLIVPVLVAISAYAVDYTDVQKLRAALDPVMYRIPGVAGSMVGSCVQGTDQDPFQNLQSSGKNVDVCLVYFVENESLLPSIRHKYKMLKMQTPIAVRFQKTSSVVDQ